MYLHLGKNVLVKTREIIGFFDLDTSTTGKITKDYVYNAEKEKEIINVSTNLPKSFIVCDDALKKKKVFISPLATSTLLRRYEKGSF